MSDWQVGDLAVCVDDTPREYTMSNWCAPAKGCIYHVVGICRMPRSGRIHLFFAELHGAASNNGGHSADRYRKIRPDEREACEPEFVTLLRRSKQKEPAMERILRAETVEAVIGRVLAAEHRRAA